MNSCEVLRAIDVVAGNKSKNDKSQLLTSYMLDPVFSRVMCLMLNPLVAFYIKPQRAKTFGQGEFNEQTWQLFDDLATRKLSGHRAIESVQKELERLTPESSELLWRILHRDPRADFSKGSINKIVPNLIPEVPYMRCSLPSDVDLDSWEWVDGVFVQVKADGTFMNITIRDGGITITSRTGFEWPLEFYPEVAERLAGFPDGQYHGEMLVEQDGVILKREVGNGMLNAVNKGSPFPFGCTPVPHLWDVITLDSLTRRGKCEIPYKDRFESLTNTVKEFGGSAIKVIETFLVHSLTEAYQISARFIKAGQEGAIVKRLLGIWKDTGSSGSPDCVKIKMEAPAELRITGYRPGKGKRAALIGSLVCQTECGQLEVAISGFDDDLLAQINADQDGWLGTIIMVTFNDVMAPSAKKKTKLYSLYLARFSCLRPDKTVADTLERIQYQFAAAKEAIGMMVA